MVSLITALFVGALGTTPLAVAPDAAAPKIHGGHHVTTDGSDGVVIQTQWVCREQCTLPVALPLPPDASLSGATEQRSGDGSIVGVVSSGRNVTFEVHVPLATVQALQAIPLAIPDRPGTHRVTFESGLAFDPDVELELAPRLTIATTPGVDGNPSRWLGAYLSEVDSGSGVARYATRADIVRARGFSGHLERAQTRRRRLLLIAGALFVLVVTALAAAHRRLAGRADQDRVDKLLAEEIDGLAASRQPGRRQA